MEVQNKRVHFSREDDLLIAQEVLGQNPYEDPSRWNVIQINILQIIGKTISIRTLKDRIRNLVNKFLKKDSTQQFKSGIEEEIDELDDLIRQISDLMKEFMNKKGASRNKDSSYQKGFDQRETILKDQLVQEDQEIIYDLETDVPIDLEESVVVADGTQHPSQHPETEVLDVPSCSYSSKENQKGKAINKRAWSQRNILNPSRKRTNSGIKQTTISYLAKKNDRTYEIRSRELALQERKQTMKEQNCELEKWERQRRVEMEEKRMAKELELFKNQQKLIEIVLEYFKPHNTT